MDDRHAGLMTRMSTWAHRVRTQMADESGASAIEYALIAGLIAAVLITALTDTGTGVRTMFESVTDALPTASSE